MSSPDSLIDSFLVMIVGAVFSVMLTATVGQIGDRVITILIEKVGIAEVAQDWGATLGLTYTVQTILFICCVLPGLYGVLVFLIAAVRRQKYEATAGTYIDYTQQYR